MIKLYIFNLEGFLDLADQCSGPVSLLTGDGKTADIRNNCGIRKYLYAEHALQGGRLNLCLNIPEVKDYFQLVNFSIGDL
ncbi:hypothetical protein [Anaerostipes sp.]|uniref:hypothetical protein n=1 Tax=Anaerostipes sp. TaxID=1872530 RepID=UPI0025C1C1FC|nr:hypothetical protein [Anaerostipes sp.]MBS7008976.1 hypothetical protein [Anaerostipes sp.]